MNFKYLKASVFALICLSFFSLQAQITTPQEHFGFFPGSDRNMFLYEDLVSYMKTLADESPMVHWEEIGETELGKPMFCFFISSAENISNLDRLRAINQQLALNEIPAGTELEQLKQEGKVFFLSTLSMHANEVGPAQALPIVAYELLTGNDKRRQLILDNTVAMFLPHNPDGMNMIVEHYNKHKGTAMETSNLPGVYHQYVGHNINRDFVTLHMSENKAVAEVYSTSWFPQAMVERHQMQSTGARFFVSPPHDPIAENVDSEVWSWMRIFGSRALKEMTDAGLEGVSVNYLFDDYWPGHTSTSKWKGVVGMLSEGASVGIATPVFIEENEIRFTGKGISENEVSINMPKPWKGGWWKLSDLMNYELENTMSYLYTSAIHKEDILEFRNNLSRREINRGMEEAPYFYILPVEQHDQSELAGIVNLLSEHGINVYELKDHGTIDQRNFRKGDIVVPLAQPYRGFIKEILEVQKFPARHYTPGGEMIKPYDITTWSLPLHRAVEAVEINEKGQLNESMISKVELPYSLKTSLPEESRWALFSSSNNESYKAAFASLKKGLDVERSTEDFLIDEKMFPAGSFLIKTGRKFNEVEQDLLISPFYLADKPEGLETEKINMPRIGIVETWIHDMDGGWTRFIFDDYHIDYKVIRPNELQTLELQKEFDILVFTDRQKSVYMQGKFMRNSKPVPLNYPPEFTKGMGKKGFENLMKYVKEGGNIMAWGPATELFSGMITLGEDDEKEEFELPFNNIGTQLASKGVYAPGSLLKVEFTNDHPVTYGMPQSTGVFHRGSPVFRTSLPSGDMDRRVLGSFANEHVLMSGYAENEEMLENLPSIIWLKKGEGQIVLSSFNPQFRASTQGTFKLLFNTLLLSN